MLRSNWKRIFFYVVTTKYHERSELKTAILINTNLRDSLKSKLTITRSILDCIKSRLSRKKSNFNNHNFIQYNGNNLHSLMKKTKK